MSQITVTKCHIAELSVTHLLHITEEHGKF